MAMENKKFSLLNLDNLETPCYLIHRGILENNLRVLNDVQKRADCKILLALKGFAMFSEFPLIRKYLYGVCASGLNEAKLGREKFGKEVHVCSVAYDEKTFPEIVDYADCIIFNSSGQFQKFKDIVKRKNIKVGMRINPEYSEIQQKIYNPCARSSRLGITIDNFIEDDVDGLMFHTMCEQNSDTLERTLKVVDEKFGRHIKSMKFMNFGGGHHITREDYDTDKLIKIIHDFREKYSNLKDVYLEPGEAVVWNAGVLVSGVLDIVHNKGNIAVLDASACCHMPDILEMPYRAEILDAGKLDEFKHEYRLAGPSCLAGDIIGDYSFKKQLKVGQKLVFLNMAHYTMVKNTTFNGINLPSIAVYNPKKNKIKVVRSFGYDDFKDRLS